MSSAIRPRLTIDIAGQAYQFATPFVTSFLTLDGEPAIYDVTIPANTAATLWGGVPLGTTFDFLALRATGTAHVECVVDGGQGDEYHFTLPLRAGNFPIVVPGGQSYAGQSGTQDSFTNGTLKNITEIRCFNPDTVNPITVSVFVAPSA